MSINSNFSALIFILLTFGQIFKTIHAAAAAKDNAAEDTDLTFLVTGGYRPATHTLTKYLVSVRFSAPDKFFGDNHNCGGSIIGPRIILTAAHCMVLHAAPFVKNDDTLEIGVEKIRVHPEYDLRNYYADIAIAKLDQDIEMDGRLAAIISLPNGAAIPGTQCTVVGWGRILPDGPMPAEAIYGDLHIREDEKCRIYPTYRKGMLCASNLDDPELDSCQGDSGGPLICDLKVVGIVSYGLGCASSFAGVYTDVWFHRKWIKENHSYRYAGSSFFISFCGIIVIVLQ